MRLEIIAGREKRLVGRNQRQIELIGESDDPTLVLDVEVAVPLNFDIEPVAKSGFQECEPFGGLRLEAGDNGLVDRPGPPAGERDQTARMRAEP